MLSNKKPTETFREYSARLDAENLARRTDPPTQQLSCRSEAAEPDGEITYPDGTLVEWVCCGPLRVFYVADNYETRVRCTICGKDVEVHSG